MANKSIRDYINLIENLQREGVAEGSQPLFTPAILPCAKCGAKARLIDWDFKGHWRVMCDNNHAMKGENITQNRAVHKWNNLQNKLNSEQGVAGGLEQVYNIIAVDKSNAMSKPKKLTFKAGSIEEVFDSLAVNDWYPLEINGVEVINGKRLKQGVAEEQLEETSPEAIAKIEQLTRR
jgi:hypothetical protein